ncbi:HoxN/HupN/NixA family nickel/cobalt transporter [Streptomyces sp. NPDC002486]
MARGCHRSRPSDRKTFPPMTAAPESTPPLPAPAPAQRTARRRVRTSMTRWEWTRAGGMVAVILALHVIGWFTLVMVVAPQHHAIGLSVAVALLIGTVELLGLLAARLDLHSPFRDLISGLDLNVLGYVVVALFFVTWAVALVVWRAGRIVQKWSGDLGGPQGS